MKLFLFCLALPLFFACKSSFEPNKIKRNDKIIVSNSYSELGIPIDSDISDDFYITRPQYVISHNHNSNVSNWVCWNLNKDWFGDVERFSGNFKQDTSLRGYSTIFNILYLQIVIYVIKFQ